MYFDKQKYLLGGERVVAWNVQVQGVDSDSVVVTVKPELEEYHVQALREKFRERDTLIYPSAKHPHQRRAGQTQLCVLLNVKAALYDREHVRALVQKTIKEAQQAYVQSGQYTSSLPKPKGLS